MKIGCALGLGALETAGLSEATRVGSEPLCGKRRFTVQRVVGKSAALLNAIVVCPRAGRFLAPSTVSGQAADGVAAAGVLMACVRVG